MNILQKLFLMLFMALGLVAPSYATVDPSVLTALTAAGADAAVMGSAVLVVLVGIAALKYLRRVL